MRADRVGEAGDDLLILCETNLGDIRESDLERSKPEIVVIDSIQTMYSESVNSAPGSVSQVREATGILMQLAKVLRHHDFYRGPCDERGRCGWPQSPGAYGGYSPLF